MNTKSVSSGSRKLVGKCLCGAFKYRSPMNSSGLWLFSIVRNSEFAHVRLGVLIDDPSIRPTFHIYVGSKAPWDTICDGLPQFAGLPDDASA